MDSILLANGNALGLLAQLAYLGRLEQREHPPKPDTLRACAAQASETLQIAGPGRYDLSDRPKNDPTALMKDGLPPARPPGGVESGAGVLDPESTIELLARVKAGDAHATEELFARCLPALRRWARGRLPAYARDLLETEDLVQETVLHALGRLEAFEARHQGALQAYLRQAVANRIRDEIRRVARRPPAQELTDRHADRGVSPLEAAIEKESLERYEGALSRLRPADREAIVARLELQYSYEEVAVALGKPTANAARVAVTRAVVRLVKEMEAGHEG